VSTPGVRNLWRACQYWHAKNFPFYAAIRTYFTAANLRKWKQFTNNWKVFRQCFLL